MIREWKTILHMWYKLLFERIIVRRHRISFVIHIIYFSNTHSSYTSFLPTFRANSLRSAKTNACSEIARARDRRGAHARPWDAAFQISRLADGNVRSSLKCRDGVFSPTSPAATLVIRCRILISISPYS